MMKILKLCKLDKLLKYLSRIINKNPSLRRKKRNNSLKNLISLKTTGKVKIQGQCPEASTIKSKK